MGFLNKKVLVTGASRGIGKAVALQLAREGAEVIIHYNNNKSDAESVLKQIEEFGGKGYLLQSNFENTEEVCKIGEKAWKIAGKIDVLINNAGVAVKKHFLDISSDEINFLTNVNFKSTLLLTQSIARQMIAHAVEGAIYTITSINGIQPGVGQSVYGATKGALETLMKGVALELAPHQIKVNTLAIGAIQTDMTAPVINNPEVLDRVNSNIPFGRMGQPEEIATLISSLIKADSYMTGATIVVDGGWLLKNGFVKPELYSKKH